MAFTAKVLYAEPEEVPLVFNEAINKVLKHAEGKFTNTGWIHIGRADNNLELESAKLVYYHIEHKDQYYYYAIHNGTHLYLDFYAIHNGTHLYLDFGPYNDVFGVTKSMEINSVLLPDGKFFETCNRSGRVYFKQKTDYHQTIHAGDSLLPRATMVQHDIEKLFARDKITKITNSNSFLAPGTPLVKDLEICFDYEILKGNHIAYIAKFENWMKSEAADVIRGRFRRKNMRMETTPGGITITFDPNFGVE